MALESVAWRGVPDREHPRPSRISPQLLTLSGQKYAPNNGSPLFLITTLETAYVECLTPSLMLRRADGCDINSNDAFGRRGLNRTQQMEAVAAKLEHTFKPGKAWNELELEDGLVDNDYVSNVP